MNHEAELRIKKLEMYLQVDNNLSNSESLLRKDKSYSIKGGKSRSCHIELAISEG